MKIKLICITILIFCNLLKAQNWKPTSTNFSFSTKMMGIGVDGRLKGFQGKIVFDPADLATASFYGTVDAATIDTDNKLRNSHLKEKSDFFEVVKFPQIKMQSTKIEKTANGYLGTFNFTMKTITKSIKIPFTADIQADKAVFKGQTKINRKDWKIGGNPIGLSNDVTINLLINTVK